MEKILSIKEEISKLNTLKRNKNTMGNLLVSKERIFSQILSLKNND